MNIYNFQTAPTIKNIIVYTAVADNLQMQFPIPTL